MVKHIVMWNFKEDVPEGEKKAIKEKAKKELEALVGVVPGLIRRICDHRAAFFQQS